MKKLLFILPLLLLFLNSKALNISSFNTISSHPLKTYPNLPTDLSFTFSVTTLPILELVLFKVQMIYFPESGTPEVIAETDIASMFNRQPNGHLWQSQLSGSLAAGKTKGKIGLRLVRYENGLSTSVDTTTQYKLDDGTPSGPSLFYVDGKFFHHVVNGKVYVYMEGKFRHIESTNTLYGVFKTNPKLNMVWEDDFNIYFSAKIGEPVGPSARIVMDNYTNRIYYQENGILRYITSPAAAERWSLDIEKRQYMNGTGSLTFGPNI